MINLFLKLALLMGVASSCLNAQTPNSSSDKETSLSRRIPTSPENLTVPNPQGIDSDGGFYGQSKTPYSVDPDQKKAPNSFQGTGLIPTPGLGKPQSP